MKKIKQRVHSIVTCSQVEKAVEVLRHMNALYGLDYGNFKGRPYMPLFTHPEFLTCLSNIETTGSLEPVFFIHSTQGVFPSETFLKEYSILLFLIYKDLLAMVASSSLSVSKMRKSRFSDLLEQSSQWYAKIESLPLEEILAAINLLVEEIPKIMQEDSERPEATVFERFKSHRWTLSLGLIILLLRICIIFKRGNTVYIHVPPFHAASASSPLLFSAADALRKNTKGRSLISRILYPGGW